MLLFICKISSMACIMQHLKTAMWDYSPFSSVLCGQNVSILNRFCMPCKYSVLRHPWRTVHYMAYFTSNNAIMHGVEIYMSPSNLVQGVQNQHRELNDVSLVHKEQSGRKKEKRNGKTTADCTLQHVHDFFSFFFFP